MPSDAKIEANRANSKLSTGPKTAEGKAKSSLNAVKTGLTGRTVLLPGDDLDAYNLHFERCFRIHAPMGEQEEYLAQSIAETEWRLLRIPALEMGIYAIGRLELADKFADQDPAVRPALIEAQTLLTYQKQLSNLGVQENRLRRTVIKTSPSLRNCRTIAPKPAPTVCAKPQSWPASSTANANPSTRLSLASNFQPLKSTPKSASCRGLTVYRHGAGRSKLRVANRPITRSESILERLRSGHPSSSSRHFVYIMLPVKGQIMPLDRSRQALDDALKMTSGLTEEIVPLIEEWWRDYKAWEADDKFLTAFKEGRMTIRQSPESQVYKDGFGVGNRNVGSGARDPYAGLTYSVGMDSLKQRLDPKNFNAAEGMRGKYLLGLHDLSGSLLDPTKDTILEQLRWKHEGQKLEEWISIFMPLAQEKDLILFYRLNDLSKEVKTEKPKIYDAVVAKRRSISRLKLGAAYDIGSGLFDISLKPHTDAPKFRYGLKAAVGEDPKTKKLNLEHIKAVEHYTNIVKLQRQTGSLSNEVVIAYRHHEGDRFPLFTKWKQPETKPEPKPVPTPKPTGESGPPLPPPPMVMGGAKQRNGMFICLPKEQSSKYIGEGLVPNFWKTTKELAHL